MTSRLRTALGGFVHSIFGTWTAPPWARWVGGHLGHAGSVATANPRRSALVATALAAVIVGSVYGYRWYESRPKPVETTFAVANPPRTAIENEEDPQPLVVTFDRPAAPLGTTGKPVSAGLTLNPALEGTWSWRDDKTLLFTPKADWPVGEEYSVRLGKEAFASQVTLKESRLTFFTAPFAAKVSRAQFYQDPTNPAAKKAVFDVNFSHPVNGPELEKHIALKLAGQ
ncbi:MAG: hypothetical protein ABIQ72_00170, partial [Usitatibacter sp.]